MDIKESKKKTKALTQKTNDIYGMIKSRSDAFQSVLPMNANTQQFVNACLIAVQDNNKLQQCNPKSLIKAMMESARFGLEPNSPLMEAALVPYGQDVQFLIEYRGMLKTKIIYQAALDFSDNGRCWWIRNKLIEYVYNPTKPRGDY